MIAICNRLMFLIICLIIGCAKRNSDPIEVADGTYKLQRLEEILKSGISKDAARDSFGPPREVTHYEDAYESWTYQNFKTFEPKDSKHVVGFQILFQSNAFVRWSPILTRVNMPEIDGNSNAPTPSDSHVKTEPPVGPLEIFRIFSSRSGFETNRLQEIPNLGFVAPEADLIITNIADVERGEDEDLRQHASTIILRLNPIALKHFGELTREHAGKHILIRIGDEQIAAPRVTGPIATPSFRIPVDKRDADRIFQSLQGLKGKE